MKDPRFKSNIRVGQPVKIIQRINQEERTGKVKSIISPLDFHPHGIKVILEDLTEGRVIEIFEPENSKNIEILEKLRQSESSSLEFKASLLVPNESIEELIAKYKIKSRQDIESLIQKLKKDIVHSAMKTIAAFANTDGGSLIIGVEDRTGKVIGLENDFRYVNNNDGDGFLIELKNQIKSYFRGTGVMATIPVMEIINIDDKDICHIQVNPSKEVCVIYEDMEAKSGRFALEKYYVRSSNSSEEFSPRDFFEKHWTNHKIKYLS